MENVLKVGDKVYKFNRNHITEIIIIKRVTKTQAISCDYKFNINISSIGTVKLIGKEDPWSFISFYIETEELKKTYEKQVILSEISKIDFKELSLDKLKEIINIINH